MERWYWMWIGILMIWATITMASSFQPPPEYAFLSGTMLETEYYGSGTYKTYFFEDAFQSSTSGDYNVGYFASYEGNGQFLLTNGSSYRCNYPRSSTVSLTCGWLRNFALLSTIY
jgi:hypothetical protein